MGQGHHQDRHLLQLFLGQGAGLIVHARRLDPALELRARARAGGALAAFGDGHVLGVRQIEGQMCGRGIALCGLGLQAAQDDFLQPGGHVRAQLARWRGRHPQALAQAALCGGRAERQLAGDHFIQHHADGKDVAAHVAAHAHDLLGGNPGGRAHGLAHLLGQQVGIVRVARQAEVQQRCRSVGLEQHVGGLEIEVAHMLLMQAVHGQGGGAGNLGDLRDVAARVGVDPLLERVALQILHHDIGQAHQIASGHETRHVRAGKRGVNQQLHLEAHDILCAIAGRHARDFHDQRKARIARAFCVGHVVDVRHASCMHAFVNDESVDLGSRGQQFHGK
ncbi:hypothetical protein SDC9_121399 [bioreactor metagenome]|uniref:Uncharacterized protein n=1 Tax=bioreactor metagenome TaxID=1076179 RepID=A0A645CBV5_9ZZZZ